MFNKTKEFIANNKQKVKVVLYTTTGIAAVCAVTFALTRKMAVTEVITYTLEEVQKYIEQAKPESKYAIFKETAEDLFQIVEL